MSCFKNKRKPHSLLYEGLREQHEWLLCRKIIVFTGSVLSIIYGLAILTATQWLKLESNKLTLAQQNISSIKNDFFIALYIMVIGLIGSISPFVRSNKDKSTKRISSDFNNNNRSVNHCVANRRASRSSFSFSSLNLSQTFKTIKNWVEFSPLFSINAILIAVIIPIELAITINTYKLMNKSEDENSCIYCDKIKEVVYRLSLSLVVLYASVIMIQICVFLYIIDLLETQINEKLFKRQVNPVLKTSIRGPVICHLRSSSPKTGGKRNLTTTQTNFEAQKVSHQMPRHPSKASTIEIDELSPGQSTSFDRYEYMGPQHYI